jgi:carbon-monoxide dehydrogenase small subunit
MEQDVTITVNGRRVEQAVPLGLLLIDFLRDICAVPSLQGACAGDGTCGTCSVLLDGRSIKACLKLAVQCDDQEVTTVEGLGKPDRPHRLQTHLPNYHGIGCGMCTPGLMMTMSTYLKEKPAPTALELREALAGHICACGNLDYLVEASLAAADRIVGRTPKPPRVPEVLGERNLRSAGAHTGASPPRRGDDHIVIGEHLPNSIPSFRTDDIAASIERETAIDARARRVGWEPATIRRKNLAENATHRRAWDALIERVDLAEFRCAQQLGWERGEYHGVGFACESPSASKPAHEKRGTLRMTRDEAGVSVSLSRVVDASEETAIAQVVADALGIDPTQVAVAADEKLPPPDADVDAPHLADALRRLSAALGTGEGHMTFGHEAEAPTFICHAVTLSVEAGTGRIVPDVHRAVIVGAPPVNPRLAALADQSAVVRALQSVLARGLAVEADKLAMTHDAPACIADIPPVALTYQYGDGAEPSRLAAFNDATAPAAGAALLNALCDALQPFRARFSQFPISAEMILQSMR